VSATRPPLGSSYPTRPAADHPSLPDPPLAPSFFSSANSLKGIRAKPQPKETSTHGNKSTEAQVNGKNVVIGLNAYIPRG
jgi:hypothetical protein